MKTYHITMSDGSADDYKGDSAADAICKALDHNRGLTVIRCFVGNHIMTDSQAGRVEYDIPPHKALPPKPLKRMPEFDTFWPNEKQTPPAQ